MISRRVEQYFSWSPFSGRFQIFFFAGLLGQLPFIDVMHDKAIIYDRKSNPRKTASVVRHGATRTNVTEHAGNKAKKDNVMHVKSRLLEIFSFYAPQATSNSDDFLYVAKAPLCQDTGIAALQRSVTTETHLLSRLMLELSVLLSLFQPLERREMFYENNWELSKWGSILDCKKSWVCFVKVES